MFYQVEKDSFIKEYILNDITSIDIEEIDLVKIKNVEKYLKKIEVKIKEYESEKHSIKENIKGFNKKWSKLYRCLTWKDKNAFFDFFRCLEYYLDHYHGLPVFKDKHNILSAFYWRSIDIFLEEADILSTRISNIKGDSRRVMSELKKQITSFLDISNNSFDTSLISKEYNTYIYLRKYIIDSMDKDDLEIKQVFTFSFGSTIMKKTYNTGLELEKIFENKEGVISYLVNNIKEFNPSLQCKILK